MSDLSSHRWGHILLIVGRVVLGGSFVYAAYTKLQPAIPGMPWSVASIKTSLLMFAMKVDSFQMLSSPQANLVAHLLPFLELLLGLWIVSGLWLRIPSLITTLLLGGFLFATIRAYVLGIKIKCGCFGAGEEIGFKTFLQDGSFLALALAVTIGAFLLARKKSAPEPSGTSTAELQQAR
jgi:uncharacterized membrane protein YphA (DoxX/SURF4 family)